MGIDEAVSTETVPREWTRRREALDFARRSLMLKRRVISVFEQGESSPLTVTRTGVGPLTTDIGKFWYYRFEVSDSWVEYTSIVKARLDRKFRPHFLNSDRILLRIDSGCQTGQIFGDLTCDCKEQLHLAMEAIEQAGEGVIICVPRQDGRGMGLEFKLATLYLQEELQLNTVQAAQCLTEGESIDSRTYSGAIAVLKFLGCDSGARFRLMTNNPKKEQIFTENGLAFERVCLVAPPTAHTQRHLEAKQEFLGHKNLIDVRQDVLEGEFQNHGRRES